MTTLHYYIIDPTKNITALVETPVPAASRPFAARRIMASEPSCEQVGFVFRNGAGEPCLAMAGGEFCGNASMSAAALICAQRGALPGETNELRLHVSGAAEPVPVRATALPDGGFSCTVTMPAPERTAAERLPLNGAFLSLPVVYYPGIAHILITENELDAEAAERVVRDWCRILSVSGLGIMLFDREARRMRPLVYVPGSDTLFWESSCASGTAALGLYLAGGTRNISLTVSEPGGALRVRTGTAGQIELSGRVEILDKRQIVVEIH